MSAFNAFVSGTKGTMLTDTAVYNAATEIIAFAQKAFPVESWNGVLSFCGNSWAILHGCDIAEAYSSFDQFIASSGAEIERRHRAAKASAHIVGPAVFQLIAMGWSEQQDRPMLFTLNSERGDDPAYVWVDECAGKDSGRVVLPALDVIEEHRLHRQGAEFDVDYQPSEFDPIRHGLPLMEAQRRTLCDPLDDRLARFHAVGGSVWCTTLTRDGLTQEVIHDWYDEIGEAISPAVIDDDALPRIPPSFVPKGVEWFALVKRGLVDPVTLMRRPDPVIAPSFGGNRADRRRLEKQQRKLARAG